MQLARRTVFSEHGSSSAFGAALPPESAGEPVERTRMDTRLSAPKRRIPGRVDEAMKNLSTRAGIHERGWRHLRVEESLRSFRIRMTFTRSLMGDQGCVHIGAAVPEVFPEWLSSDSDLEEDGGDSRLQSWSFQPPTSCETPAQSSASSSSTTAGPAKSGKGTKEASCCQLASAGILRWPPAHWSCIGQRREWALSTH